MSQFGPTKSHALTSEKDKLFAADEGAPAIFRFDDEVANVFPDMLRRSIPGYATLLHLIGVYAAQSTKDDSVIYDLGCSLGAASLSIRHALGARCAHIIAVDNSVAMVQRCKQIISADSALCPVTVILGDIATLKLEPCSLVVMNFTLQFVPKAERLDLLKHISEQLTSGGSLIISEKTHSADGTELAFHHEMHDAFRRSNGYSQMELSRKREALENVLTPQTVEEHEQNMRAAGLRPVQWFRCLQFVSWVAVKE